MAKSDYYGLTDAAIARIIGARIRALRLRRNLTQEDLHAQTGLSIGTIIAIEDGRGKLENIIGVLRALRGLDELDAFLPEPVASPIDLAKRQGRTRQRATGSRARRAVKRLPDGGGAW